MIGIVGGGITGLSLAHRLHARGVECVVLEAKNEPGGVIRTRRVEGHILDWGPQRARLVGDLQTLVEELGLRDQVVSAPDSLPLFVYRGGRLRKVPFSAGAFLTADIISWAGKARMALEPLTAGADPAESVAHYFKRKVGRELYENLIGPLYGGLYGSDPEEMIVGLSLGHVLREFNVGRSLITTFVKRGGRVSPPPACTFRDGMQTLPRALASGLGERVRLSTPVRELRAHGPESWSLVTDHEVLEVEQVVLTAPAPVVSKLLEPVAPDAATRIGRLNYNPLGVVHLHADTDLVGLGYQVSLAEDLSMKGVTFNDSLFGRTGVYTAYMGGAKRPEVVGLPDEELSALAVNEFRHCTGFDARALVVERERMPAWDRSWEALQGMEIPGGLHIAANWESRPGIPGRLAQTRRLAERLAVGV